MSDVFQVTRAQMEDAIRERGGLPCQRTTHVLTDAAPPSQDLAALTDPELRDAAAAAAEGFARTHRGRAPASRPIADVIPPAQVVRVPMMMMDGAPSTVLDALDERDRFLRDAWMSPPDHAGDLVRAEAKASFDRAVGRRASSPTPPTTPLADSSAQAAWEARGRELRDAWQG